MSQIEILEGMPSYKSIKKIWTKKELEDIFGIKIRISSYSDSEIIEAYTRVKAMYGNVTSKLMKQETGIGVDSIRIRFGSWNKFLIFLHFKYFHKFFFHIRFTVILQLLPLFCQ